MLKVKGAYLEVDHFVAGVGLIKKKKKKRSNHLESEGGWEASLDN